jgi:hypothetical protein
MYPPPHDPFPCYTGIGPNATAPQYFATPKNNWELVEQYYLKPLCAMSGHQAFVCLTICFPLYEKLLRKTLSINDEEKFSKDHKVFKEMGTHWDISTDVAFEFWQHWRNGLLHRAMPKTGDGYRSWLAPNGDKALTVDKDGHLSIQPWLFRDQIVALLEKSKGIWKDSDFPLLQEIRSQ